MCLLAFVLRCCALDSSLIQVLRWSGWCLMLKWKARENMSSRSGKRGWWREKGRAFSTFHLFVLLKFRVLDYLGAWNRSNRLTRQHLFKDYTYRGLSKYNSHGLQACVLPEFWQPHQKTGINGKYNNYYNNDNNNGLD